MSKSACFEEEDISARYPAVRRQLVTAVAALSQHAQDGNDSGFTEAHICGLAEALSFLETAHNGLYDNRDVYGFHNSEFILNYVKPGISAGELDMMLTRFTDALETIQKGEKPTQADVVGTKNLLQAIIDKMPEE